MTMSEATEQRTLAFAEIALAQIKALSLSATPKNYEVWYLYATGYNNALNAAVNEALAHDGSLNQSQLDELYDRFLSPKRITDHLDKVGSQVMDEIGQVMSMVDAAVGSASSYSASLADVSTQLVESKDGEDLRSIVESLLKTTHEMRQSNETLEARLNASKQEISQLQQSLELVRTESLTDPLTSLSNRKSFDESLVRLLVDAQERGEPLTLLMMDVDHFKQFNDQWGHLTGDQVLRLVASSLKQNVKGFDIAARYGGEEFAVILPNTIMRAGLSVADNVRRAVVSKELLKRSTGQNLGRVTVSLGVATARRGDTARSLLARADECLYAAKRNGRNRVICELDPEVALRDIETRVA